MSILFAAKFGPDGYRGWTQEPPTPQKCENFVEIATFQQFFPAYATQYIDPDEIKPVEKGSVHWPTVACQFGPDIVSLRMHAASFADVYGCLNLKDVSLPSPNDVIRPGPLIDRPRVMTWHAVKLRTTSQKILRRFLVQSVQASGVTLN